MTDPEKPQTQTTPNGYEIPIPARKDFDAMLDAVAKPVPAPKPKKASRTRRPKK